MSTGLGPLVSVSRPVLKLVARALPWVLARPFILRLETWVVALIAWAAICAVLLPRVLASVDALLAIATGGALVALLIVLAVGTYAAAKLVRGSAWLIVCLTRFLAETGEAASASITHLSRMRQRLESEDVLRAAIELRDFGVPVSRRAAEGLLETTPARAVIYGEVLVAGGQAHWQAELLTHWPIDSEPPPIPPASRGEGVTATRRESVPIRHELFTDPGLPLERLVAEPFDPSHVEMIVATLLALAAAVSLEESHAR